MIVACQGTSGAFSNLAANELFPDARIAFYPSFQETLTAVSNDNADCAVVPVENSVAGRVMDIHNLLPHTHLYITGEHFLRIEQQLLGLPQASLSDIRIVLSHPQALSQCSRFLTTAGLTVKSVGNTALAAQTVAEKGDVSLAAIASKVAAQTFGLKILKHNIENDADNTTRFWILSKRPAPPPAGDNVITSLIFFIPNVPAALYNALGAFAHHGVNLTRLENYIDCKKRGSAAFFADIQANPADAAFKEAFRELKEHTEKISVLGVYPASEKR